mgnify:FL=1
MKILHVFEVRGPETPTRFEVRVAQQIDTAMQNNYKWIRSQWESTLVCETGFHLKIAS